MNQKSCKCSPSYSKYLTYSLVLAGSSVIILDLILHSDWHLIHLFGDIHISGIFSCLGLNVTINSLSFLGIYPVKKFHIPDAVKIKNMHSSMHYRKVKKILNCLKITSFETSHWRFSSSAKHYVVREHSYTATSFPYEWHELHKASFSNKEKSKNIQIILHWLVTENNRVEHT